MIAFRFLGGMGGSASLPIDDDVLKYEKVFRRCLLMALIPISNCWHPDQRGEAAGIHSLAHGLGPLLYGSLEVSLPRQ
jgi:hypothetical protein